MVLASLQEKAKEGKGTCDRPEDRTASEELQGKVSESMAHILSSAPEPAGLSPMWGRVPAGAFGESLGQETGNRKKCHLTDQQVAYYFKTS